MIKPKSKISVVIIMKIVLSIDHLRVRQSIKKQMMLNTHYSVNIPAKYGNQTQLLKQLKLQWSV